MALPPLLLAAAAASPAAGDCAGLRGANGDVVVTAATVVSPGQGWQAEPSRGAYAAIPVNVAFCRVEGTIEGSIGFELWLPATWNGRLLGAGVGGDAGVFNYRDMAIRVAQGFATVTTDSGHKIADARWMRGAKARVDYEHRAVHLTAQAAKGLLARYYGKPANRAYYLGCSGGGRQALKEMQNYPGDYDGVVAGAPGPYMPLQSVRMLWFSLAQQRQPAAMLTDAEWALYEARVFAQCDALDGVKDGIVQNPLACRFRTATLLCRPGQVDGCLTAPKLAMLDRIVAPMPDEKGRPMDWGLFPGVRTRPGPPSPLLRAMWADAVYDNPDWDATTFRRSADLAAANRVMPELRADKLDISGFLKRGNKAIIYQGWQDPSTNAGPTIRYYGKLAAAQGGPARLGQSVRLFMVPGMYHCRGGPGANLFGGMSQSPVWPGPERDVLWSLVQWVEQGRKPEEIVATKRDGDRELFTRKLCPFPQSARWDGKGPSDKAASYACRTDPLLVRLLAKR
ncbi:MAG: tannase/feruloyl esterase family alpha/beta hydrolase [Sphingomonadales bacterium]|nr:tannase/feruloyl esterase family alpha/beta hydrolase [Sphingomonadales bacterium]